MNNFFARKTSVYLLQRGFPMEKVKICNPKTSRGRDQEDSDTLNSCCPPTGDNKPLGFRVQITPLCPFLVQNSRSHTYQKGSNCVVCLASAFFERQEGRGCRGQDTGFNTELIPGIYFGSADLTGNTRSMRCAREYSEMYYRTFFFIVGWVFNWETFLRSSCSTLGHRVNVRASLCLALLWGFASYKSINWIHPAYTLSLINCWTKNS